MITITKKVRAWKEGEAVQPVEFDSTKLADLLADRLAEVLRGDGDEPITVTVRLDVSATILAKHEKEVA